MTFRLIPAVLSGGSGTRLWPLSTDDRPKQFHALCTERTMFQDTLARFAEASDQIEVLAPIVIGSGRHGDSILAQARELGIEPSAAALEPMGRNSAPAAAVAARLAQEQDPEALVILMAADHLIPDTASFRRTVAAAAHAALSRIVVFGVEPTGPETGYGYIESGAPIEGDVRQLVRFAEKPDLETARAYLASGRYMWNAGIFLFSPAVLLQEMARLAPNVLAACDRALETATHDGPLIRLGAEAFAAAPSISLDYAVMEKTDKGAVIPMGTAWADVGSWAELWRQGKRDLDDNRLHGDVLTADSRGNMVWSEGRTVAVLGVKDLIVVETSDAVLVMSKSRAQDVKLMVEQFKARSR